MKRFLDKKISKESVLMLVEDKVNTKQILLWLHYKQEQTRIQTKYKPASFS
jgi:hypothetical protein